MTAMARSSPRLRTRLPARRTAAALAALLLAACGGGSSSSGGGSSSSKPVVAPAPRRFVTITLPGAEQLGWLAVAPIADEQQAAPHWLPTDDAAALMLLPEGTPEPPLGTEVLAVPMRGAAMRLAIAERRKIRYGCDDNQLDGIALQATQLAEPPAAPDDDKGAAAPAAVPLTPPPGPVWILPNTPGAAAWKPSGLEITLAEQAADRRIWTVGPLRFALTTRDRSHATFTAAIATDAGTVWLMQRELPRPLMEGAEDLPIDLTQETPGMPQLAGAFSIVPDGPLLLVLAVPGYEGTQLTTLLYDGTSLREVETMQRYLYACAF